jgi:hypothetical protein
VTFQKWVESQIRERFGTATALAAAIGMELSPFTRGVKAGTLNVPNLLQLAKVTDTPPLTVLRMAGKEPVADLLAELFGTEAAGGAADRFRVGSPPTVAFDHAARPPRPGCDHRGSHHQRGRGRADGRKSIDVRRGLTPPDDGEVWTRLAILRAAQFVDDDAPRRLDGW